jgi:DNA-binding NtrC family response regulator
MRLLNVVVVDPDPACVRSIARVLNHSADREQFDVHYFTDAAEAQDWIQASDCDLMIAGLDLLGRDCQRLAREAKQRNPLVQLIVTATEPTVAQLQQLAAVGVSEFLQEPLDKLLLRDLVEQSIARIRRWEAPLRSTRKPMHTQKLIPA